MRSCFVIIGYGKKTSYANGKPRVLDLDETFTLLIKPVFDGLGIPCYRAIDKNISGSIDKQMLQEIRDADLVVADISTLNANVMWELGVRHALKPRYTIMICEKEQMASVPFDINHFVVHQYVHSEEGIPHREVDRFHLSLSGVLRALQTQSTSVVDSPVFTFLNQTEQKATEIASHDHQLDSFATILRNAEDAKNAKQFDEALRLFTSARSIATASMTLRQNLTFIISRQALCSYKSKRPTEEQSLDAAKNFLSELDHSQSQDIEVLGLSGAIYKRLYEITNQQQDLNTSIQFYEKGFQLKQDYYNGINAAFMLYKKACLLKQAGNEWQDIRIKADYIRNTVLEIALRREQEEDFLKSKDDVWVLFTIAEAYHYKGNEIKRQEYEGKALNYANKIKDSFAPSSYQEQKKKVISVVSCLE
jgi:hypothetical protein